MNQQPCDNNCDIANAAPKPTSSFFLTSLLAAILGFVPLVVYWRLVNYQGIIGELLNKTFVPDFFVFYKAAWIYLLTGAAVLWFLAYRQFAVSRCPKSLIVYAAMAVMSTAFAAYPDLAIYGDPQRFEGLFMHIAYMAIVFLFMNLVTSRFAIRVILSPLLFSAGIIALLGVMQFFGYDYFSSPYGGFWLMPQHFRENITNISSLVDTTTPSYSVFSTFGNSNFAGIYVAMLFPLSLVMFLGTSSWRKALLFFLNAALYAGLLSCSARAAMLSALCASVLAFWVFRGQIRRQLGWIMLLLCTFILLPFIFDAFTLRHDLPRYFSASVGRPLIHSVGSYGRFNDLQLNGDTAVTDFDGFKLKIKYNNGAVEFYDASEELVPHRMLNTENATNSVSAIQITEKENFAASASGNLIAQRSLTPDPAPHYKAGSATVGTGSAQTSTIASNSLESGFLVVFPRTKLPGFVIQAWPDRSMLRIGRGGVTYYLGYTENGFKLLGGRSAPLELKEVESWGFKGREGFGSGRGYIWSRSLPLLKQTFLVGFGPDTFMAHFPNHDYLGKLRHWGSGMGIMIEKPHNLYLQIAINLGGIALLAMLFLWGSYLVESAKLYWNSGFSDSLEVCGAAIFVAVFSYLVDGLFNDSIVGVAQVFWGLLGMGFAINRMIIAKREKKSSISTLTSQVTTDS